MTLDLFFHANHAEQMPDPEYSNLIPEDLPSVSDIDLNNNESFGSIRLQKIAAARNVLLSLVYPETADTIIQAAPPKVLFVWPNMFSMVTRVMSVDIRHERFTQDGATRQFKATVVFEESRLTRLVHNDVLQNGTKRSDGDEDYGAEIFDIY
jgi:hypothetical protein